VGLYAELFYAIIPYLVSMLFADLLSLHLVTFLMFFFYSCVNSVCLLSKIFQDSDYTTVIALVY